MLSLKWTSAVAVGISVVVVALCFVGIWGEYRVATTRVPGTAMLRAVSGQIDSCTVELDGVLGPNSLLHGAWDGAPTYLFTLRGVAGRFRTHAFACGVGPAGADAEAFPPRTLSFRAPIDPADEPPGVAPLFNAYGLTVDGVVIRTLSDDLQGHRRAHGTVAPINLAGLLLLVIVMPGLIIGAMHGRLWRREPDEHVSREGTGDAVARAEGIAGE